MSTQLHEAFLRQVVRVMADNVVYMVLGNIVASLVIGFYFWSLSGAVFFIWWMAAITLIAGARFILNIYLAKPGQEKFTLQQKHDLYCAGILASGLSWSFFTLYVFLSFPPAQNYLLYPFVAGVTTTALISSGGSTRAFLLFAVPVLAPMALQHIVVGSDEQMLIGAMIVVYGVLLWLASRSTTQSLKESATYNFENKKLLENLVKEKEHIMQLNERLQHDLKKRVGVMEWLATGRGDQEYYSEEMHVLSTQDALTGLANRRHFNEVLKREWAGARRDQSPVALVKCDIDFFREYNESLGQQEGDLCLASIGACLADLARRTTDLVARYSEDEFIILLPRTTESDALDIAEEIRKAVLTKNIPHPSSKKFQQVTLTLGVAALTPHRQINEISLLKQADIALYRAKKMGRNCTTSYTQTDSQHKVTLQDLINPGKS